MYVDGRFQIEHDDSLCFPLSEVCIDGENVDDEHEYSLTLLKRYGNGPLGAYDVICIHNCATNPNEYEFIPAYKCDAWTVVSEVDYG